MESSPTWWQEGRTNKRGSGGADQQDALASMLHIGGSGSWEVAAGCRPGRLQVGEQADGSNLAAIGQQCWLHPLRDNYVHHVLFNACLHISIIIYMLNLSCIA